MFKQFDLTFFLDQLSWISVLDVMLVTLLIFAGLIAVRGTRAVQMLRGLILFALVLILIDSLSELTALRWLIQTALPALFVAIPVIFQPEIRRAFTRLGETGGVTRFFRRQESMPMIPVLADSCRRLSNRRHGALIIIERDTGLQEYIDTGIQLNADITTPLMLAVFHKDAELHDGGVIIRGEKMMAASCVMPLSSTRMGDQQMGLRHRAALGTSEVSDAVVIVVSEETGHIAIAHQGKIMPRQQQQQLEKILEAFLLTNSGGEA